MHFSVEDIGLKKYISYMYLLSPTFVFSIAIYPVTVYVHVVQFSVMLSTSESDLHSCEATRAVAKKAQKKILRLHASMSFESH